jgi:outer membrane protein assembly factor BamD (BamD/ComL family)
MRRELLRVLIVPGIALGPLLGVAGCSLLSPEKAMLADYDETRRNIENPIGYDLEDEGDYRPEGATVERGKEEDFLQRMGLRAKRRKDIEEARTHYHAGDDVFEKAKSAEGDERKKLFRQAAQEYNQAASSWRSSGLEQDALLMAAESHFFAEDYKQAEELYAQLVKEYPRNPYLDHVNSRQFEIGDYWLKADAADHKPFMYVNFYDNKFPWNDTGGHGKRVLERLRLDNPTGKVSDDATMRLAVEDFQKGKFESAADTFADLRLTYPDSEHQFKAQMLEMQSLLESYQGADYSSIPLTEAQQRVKQLAKQFPQEASEHETELNQAYAKIRFLMAERIWQQAYYRYKRGENGSAKFHYNRLLDDYSDTPFAEQAKEMLAKLEDAPDDPPQRFQFLVDLFGATTDDRPWLKDQDASSE